jgi:hypothetical protein
MDFLFSKKRKYIWTKCPAPIHTPTKAKGSNPATETGREKMAGKYLFFC